MQICVITLKIISKIIVAIYQTHQQHMSLKFIFKLQNKQKRKLYKKHRLRNKFQRPRNTVTKFHFFIQRNEISKETSSTR